MWQSNVAATENCLAIIAFKQCQSTVLQPHRAAYWLQRHQCSNRKQPVQAIGVAAVENGKAAIDVGDEELDVDAWGDAGELVEPGLGDEDEANGDLLDADGHVETGLEAGDEEGGWEMEVRSQHCTFVTNVQMHASTAAGHTCAPGQATELSPEDHVLSTIAPFAMHHCGILELSTAA